MAGSYPDVPNHRIEYDRDGTVGFMIRQSDGGVAALTTSQLRSVNNESTDGVFFSSPPPGPSSYFGLIFPALRTIAGYFIHAAQSDGSITVLDMHTSADTTNGVDGTWTTVANPWVRAAATLPNYRSGIQSVSFANIKAIRFHADSNAGSGGMTYYTVHLYAPQTSTLQAWHPTLDQAISGASHDYGDVAAGGSYSRQFRIKNTHGSQTAHAVAVTAEALTDKTPSMVGAQHLFSVDGGAYAVSVSVGDLAPGAISDVITVQRDIPPDVQSGLGSGRIVAQAGSWS